MIPTRGTHVLNLLERSEETLRVMALSRSVRLGRLVSLDAPDYIIANELVLVLEALEALFRKHDFNPMEDDRVFRDLKEEGQ